MIAGNLTHHEGKFYMKKPKMVIGSDKTELFEFIGRKREHCYMNIRNFIKLSVAVTLVHVLLVRIPGSFESWFGDKLTPEVKPDAEQALAEESEQVQTEQAAEK